MKKLMTVAILPWLMMAFGHKAIAQETPKASENRSESQEIIIRKKGDKDVTLNLQFTDDKVIVNGKPLLEFNDDGITINKKKIVINTDRIERDINGMIDNFHFEDFGPGSVSGNFAPRPFLGVVSEKADDGVKIISVTKESAAEIAGLQKDDIITKVNDKKIATPDELMKLITGLKAKDEVKISYKRADSKKEKTTKAILKEMKGAEVRSFTFTSPEGGMRSLSIPRNPQMGPDVRGFNMQRDEENNIFTNIRKQKLGIKIQDTEDGTGVKILGVDEGSPAETAGIKKEDILTELNGKKINNTDEARQLLMENMENANYPVKVKRSGNDLILNVKIPRKLKTADL